LLSSSSSSTNQQCVVEYLNPIEYCREKLIQIQRLGHTEQQALPQHTDYAPSTVKK